MSEDTQITLTLEDVDSIVLDLLSKHLDIIILDKEEFLDLLKHSLSLNTTEKKRVLDAVPTLSQFQFDELKKVFLEEREKFKELAGEHPDDIKKLVERQQKEWLQLGDVYKAEEEKKGKEDEDSEKIDDIKNQLGL